MWAQQYIVDSELERTGYVMIRKDGREINNFIY